MSKFNLNLNDRKWGEFRIEDLFNVTGTVTTRPEDLISSGLTPRITCSATNNGLDDFYSNIATEKGKVLTVDSATIGYIAYQEHDFIATDHVEKIMSDKIRNKFIGLFLKNTITNSIGSKYNYGYKFSQTRIKRQTIQLPITENGEPDYAFMENFIKERMYHKLKQYNDYLDKQIAQFNFSGSLKEKQWGEFFITDIFPKIQRGKRLIRENQISGTIPYVSSSALNNGVDNFIQVNHSSMRQFENCISLANSGSVGSAFYEPFHFIASDHITHLKNEKFNGFIYLFIANICNRLSKKYNFNREINDKRIKREKIMLPITPNGEPDYAFMENYTRNLMLKKYKKYAQLRLQEYA